MRTFLLLFSLSLLLYSCKEDDNKVEPMAYTPLATQLSGAWTLHSSINNKTQSVETYPETLDQSSITFEPDNSLRIKIICNFAKSERVIVSESGAILIADFNATKLACNPIDLYNTWNQRINNTLDHAVSVSIENGFLTLRGSSDFSLVFKR